MIVVANCVHLLVALQQRLRAGDSRHDAIVESIGLNLQPVFLASLTTALGFLSMNFSEVPPYRHLGNFVAFGVAASFLLSVTFLPAVLSLLPIRAAKDRPRRGLTMNLLADSVLRYRRAIIWGWLVIVATMSLAIPRNELNDVLVHFFDESVEFRQDTDFMDEHLSGNTLLEYSLQARTEGGVTDPRFLATTLRSSPPGTANSPPYATWRSSPIPFSNSTRACTATTRPLTGYRKARSWRHNTWCFTSCRCRRV